MKLQSDKTKRAEIRMRREQAAKEDPELVVSRLRARLDRFPLLDEAIQKKRKPLVGEIGAGFCQNILGLIEKHNLPHAVAFDISAETLEFSRHISRLMFTFNPVERLTLVDGDIIQNMDWPCKFDVLLAVATCHHFPDPVPLFARAWTMLKPGGVFYFDREPLRSWIGLHEVARHKEWIKTMKDRRMGVLETQFSYKTWVAAISLFDEWDVRVKWPGTKYEWNLKDIKWWQKILIRLVGGRIYGTCKKL